MNRLRYSLLLLLASPCFSATLASRLEIPFGITANDRDASCGGGSDASTLAAQIGTVDSIIIQWSEMHALQQAVIDRVARDRAAGLNIMIGMSPTRRSGLRTDIDLPDWVASTCSLTQNTASFSNPCLQSQFIADATTYAALIQPEYFHLATEINTLILRKLVVPSDMEFVFFGNLYQAAVPAVKAVSPNSKLFVSFQYELQTKLEQDNPGGWDAMLSALRGSGTSLLDFVGYTTYPSSSGFLGSGLYATPWDIPTDYYGAAAAHLASGERVAFSEVGWPTQGSGSEAGQKTYLDRLPELMAPAYPALVTLALLHDVPSAEFEGNESLATVGVLSCRGSMKPGWAILTGAAGGVSSNSSPLESIQIFPNPLRPAMGQRIMHFTGVPPATRLRIYTTSGELVRELSANPYGNASWDGLNLNGRNVASGVYFLYAQGGGDTKTLKLAVQR